MAVYTKCPAAVEALCEADNVGTAVWKVALCSASPVAATTFTAGSTDLATGGGYTQGGNIAATVSSTQTSGVMKLVLSDPADWTATGGGFTFRYVLLYNSTTNIPYGFWDYGSNVVMNGSNADTFTADLDQTNGVFTAT